MDDILHHLRNPAMIAYPCKYPPTMVSTMVSKWCEVDFAIIHSMFMVKTKFLAQLEIASVGAVCTWQHRSEHQNAHLQNEDQKRQN